GVYGEFFTNALKASFYAIFALLDEDLNTITSDTAPVTNLPSGNWVSWQARYGAAPVYTPVNGSGPVGSLGPIVALPGQECQLFSRLFAGGDGVAGNPAWAWVTKMDFGVSATPGQPTVEFVGPALYVPGPYEQGA